MRKNISILDQYKDYAVNIGIEIHVQLTTKSKLFCASAHEQSEKPNSNICSICAGHPGVLPVLNKKAVDYAILAGLATDCSISKLCSFARKHYFYPDLPKGFQTTQGDIPICTEGFIYIRLDDGSEKKIRLTRIHIEEDAGKNIHASGSDESFVDLNRAGTPLLEIVSYPDIESTDEAKSYLKTIHTLVQYLNICSGNMQEGAFRADTNISVRKKNNPELGTRCELKNINSFKFITDAIEYEIQRQIELIESGKPVDQETRLWDTKKNVSRSMRSKEDAQDYRYFSEPDLPSIVVSEEWIARMQKTMPELPRVKQQRLINDYGLLLEQADIIVNDLALVQYFEKAAQHTKSKRLINWILRDLMAYVKEFKISLFSCRVTPQKIAQIVDLLDQNKINNNAASQIFLAIAESGGEPAALIEQMGLQQIGSMEDLEKIIQEIIAKNPNQVEQFKNGKQKLFGFFVGQAMQKTKGNADPKVLQELIKKYLK